MAEAGIEVTLFEAKKSLGGRAFSFRDPSTGLVVDNGQHVILGCCEEAIAFLQRLGSLDGIRFFDEIEFLFGDGERLTLRGSSLPAPLTLMPSLTSCSGLSREEKSGLMTGLARALAVRPARIESARDYFVRVMKSAGLLGKVVEPVLVAALNEDMSDASAVYARMVVLKTLLGGHGAHKLGVPQKPLSTLIGDPGRRFLEERGCAVVTADPVKSFDVDAERINALVAATGGRRAFDYFVLAVKPWELRETGFEIRTLGSLVWRSIITAHLFYGGEPPAFDQVCVPNKPFGWIFHKRDWAGVGVVYVQAVASAADVVVNAPDSALLELAQRAVTRAVPELAGCAPVRSILCRSRRATFSTGGASDALRPGPETCYANAFLAGDWTCTGWPSTLESAVRSGRRAAARVNALV